MTERYPKRHGFEGYLCIFDTNRTCVADGHRHPDAIGDPNLTDGDIVVAERLVREEGLPTGVVYTVALVDHNQREIDSREIES